MRPRLLLTLIVAVTCVQAAPAGAEEQSPFAAQVMQDFGRCAAKLHRDRSISLLDQEPSSASGQKIAEIIAHNSQSCLAGNNERLAFQASLLRGAVAEGLYRDDFPTRPALVPDTDPEFAPRKFMAADDVDPEAGLRSAVFHGFAACVVDAAPLQAHDLLQTEAASGEERTAFAAMADALSICLPQGESFEIQPHRLRAALAEALYRASVAYRRDVGVAAAAPAAAVPEIME